MNHVCLDGEIVPADQPILRADNRSYRYGDGLFETMKVVGNRICLAPYHFERFFSGLNLLQFEIPHDLTAEKLAREIILLCERNECAGMARARLSAFGGNGGLYDGNRIVHYVIQCWPASGYADQLDKGLSIGIYPDARKSCDLFANLKSANYLPYVMAAGYATKNKWDDCLVLNTHDRIAEATIANIFLIKEDLLITPPLSEGCVNGVMRRHLLEKFNVESLKLKVKEQPVSAEDLAVADEIFLTNATTGIRWVKQIGDKKYINVQTAKIYDRFVKTICE